ncbi:reverse transcriptase domain-containing protein [Actinoplanes sp. L3-i22]|uniref:reverse transcriptase domain-containing protein n=1 Tax=Actinoplanes sp. L3-i22 TaxID=2836373 RepID=UPI001C75143F|nr:reverse transcriptase domain-containing protein [Actinoplanes sp. L3-i22]BCY11053.1 hypothetical protein L3i22_061410 [Actinoplanes sp. L3-i22]
MKVLGGGIVPAAQADNTVADQGRAAHSLVPYLIDVAHLHRAARLCMRRSSAPGADGLTWAGYRRDLRGRLAALAARLADGTWQPAVNRLVDIETYTGKLMTAVIPTVEDRIVHRAMRTAVDPLLDAWLAPWVSAYRPRRNRLTAVRQAAAHLSSGNRWIVDVDVADASFGGDVDECVGWLAEIVHDGTFLDRVRTAITGLPWPMAPGTGLWPVLFQLRLGQADRLLDGLHVVRFADNYTVFAANREHALAAFDRISDALARLGLKPNRRKSRIREPGTSHPEDLYLIDG